MSAKNKTAADPKPEGVKAEATEEVTATPVKEAPKPVKQEKKENVVYVGPTVIGVAKSGSVFKDGILPAKAQECISELPMMKRLFVPQSQYVGAAKELSEKQSALSAIYREVTKKLKGGK
jgi:hypothetical protein